MGTVPRGGKAIESMAIFHSTNFPSEWGAETSVAAIDTLLLVTVSIQLISPASGESRVEAVAFQVCMGFHSTNFPSEWGALTLVRYATCVFSFHSTNFPNEWGAGYEQIPHRWVLVSIQLISPTSGE